LSSQLIASPSLARSADAIHNALLKWRDSAVAKETDVIFPLVWPLEKLYKSTLLLWQQLTGKDRIIADILDSYNTSSSIPDHHRLQLRFHPTRGDMLSGQSFSTNGSPCEGPTFSGWRLAPSNRLSEFGMSSGGTYTHSVLI
jgi:hypothetical protein